MCELSDEERKAAGLIESIASMGGIDDLLRSLPGGAGQGVLDGDQSRTGVSALNEPGNCVHHGIGPRSAEFQEEDEFEPCSNI